MPVTTAIVDLTAPARAEHTILVKVDRPFRPLGTLDGGPPPSAGPGRDLRRLRALLDA